MMSLLAEAARGIAAVGVASKLGPANYVDSTPDIICCVVCCILVMTSFMFLFMNTENKTDSTETAKGTAKQFLVGTFTAVIISAVTAGILHNLRWNFANPGYFAASEGLNALF